MSVLKGWFAYITILGLLLAGAVFVGGSLVGVIEALGASQTLAVALSTILMIFAVCGSLGCLIDGCRAWGRSEGLEAAIGLCNMEGPDALFEVGNIVSEPRRR